MKSIRTLFFGAVIGLLLAACTGPATAYEVYTPKGTINTYREANAKTGLPQLRQDSIDNANSDQPTRVFRFVAGRNSNVNNALCDLWDGPTCRYVFPASPMQMRVVSTSANDALAGTGTQKVMIHYLDTNYVERTEIVSTNGLTPVNTVATNILRVNRFHAYQSGSNGLGVGAVSLQNTAGTVTYAYINAGFNTARQAIYTIPAGKYGYISHWQASSGAVSGSHFTPVFIASNSSEGVLIPTTFLAIDEIGTLNNAVAITLPIPIRVPPTTDVKMLAISDAANANTQVMGAIMGWLEDQ